MSDALTFAAEPFADAITEAVPLMAENYNETGYHGAAFDPDIEAYSRLAGLGVLHVIVARAGGRMVGYAVFLLTGSLHARGIRTASCDTIWLLPAFRRGRAGLLLLRAAEAHMRAAGADRMAISVKLERDIGPLLAREEYRAVERTHVKELAHG